MNHDAKLIAVYDKLEAKLRQLKEELASVEKQQGPQGEQGLQGPKGEQGDRGRDGVDGKDGSDGIDGAKGRDGEDGISITNVSVDFDNHLRVDLSDGNTIDAGAIDLSDLEQGVTKIIGMGGSRSSAVAEGTIVDFTYVASVADLPACVGNVITLEADHTYYFVGTVDLNGCRLVGQFNTCILGSSSENAFITSTGLGAGVALFTSAWTTPIRHVTFKDVDTCLDIDGTGNDPVALDWTGVNFSNIPNIGTIANVGNFIFTKGALLSAQGLIFDGTHGTISIADSLLQGTGSAGAIVTIPSTASISRRFRIIYSSVIAFGSTTGLDVSASATIPAQGYILDTINFGGGSTYLSGLDYLANQTLFSGCVGISNSREVSQYYMNGNTTATTIAAVDTPTKILGTTTSGSYTSKFTNTDNRATYTGSRTRTFHVIATLSFTAGTNDQIGSYIAKNGAVLSDSEMYVQTDTNGDFANATIQTLIELATNDYIEVFIENASDSGNITVADLNVIIQ